MAWQTPKTDWEIKPYLNGRYQGDWFNVEDYNRIAGNQRYLHAAGQNVYGVTFSIASMVDQVINAFPHAIDINVLEDNLYAIVSNTYSPPDYTGKKTWTGNGATPTVDDLNRIERACADILAKYDETPLKALVTATAEPFITSDGNTFMVR